MSAPSKAARALRSAIRATLPGAKAIGQDVGERFTLLHTEPVDDPKAVENAAHWELRAKHIQHEWFDVTLDEAMAAISIAVANVAAGIHPPTRIGHSKPFADEPKDVRGSR